MAAGAEARPAHQPYGGQPGYPAQPQTQPYQGFPQQQTQAAQPRYGAPQYGPPSFDQGGHDPYDRQDQYDSREQYGGYDEYGHDQGPQRSPSMRTLTIAVVAGCAVLGVGLGALLSGGAAASASAGKAGGAARHGASAGPGPADKSAQLEQAQKLSELLETASSNRSAVVNAVASVQACQALQQAQQTLTSAAQARADLVTQLDQLQVSALPSGTELVAKLTAGWQASQQADSHYAAWAAESTGPCQKKHHPKDGGEKAAGDAASSNATLAKREAAELWNRIASANNLPAKSPERL
jgi:hypothetical protein